MQDVLNSILLICAAIASLGFGVTLAFGVCRAAFAILRNQTRSTEPKAVSSKTQVAEI
jgi:hypothetical protein